MITGKPSIWTTLYRYKLHHPAIWVVYYFFWMLFMGRFFPSTGLLVKVVTIYFVFQMTLFYTTAYYLFPTFLYKQRYWSFALIFLSLAVALAFLQGFFFSIVYENVEGEPPEYSSYLNLVQTSFVNTMIMVGLMSCVKLVIERMRTLKLTQQREQQRLENELHFLRAQINPHFLFNTINSVYFLIRKDPDQAAETLIKLSDLLRFQLYDCSDEVIAIEKEIDYLQNFIMLEKVRKGQKVQVNVELSGLLSGFQLPPFILMPFIENAFKHVSNSSSYANEISIRIKREGAQLQALVENTTEHIAVSSVGGIGLRNVKRRLELLYPGKHLLTIREEGNTYSVQLTLAIE